MKSYVVKFPVTDVGGEENMEALRRLPKLSILGFVQQPW